MFIPYNQPVNKTKGDVARRCCKRNVMTIKEVEELLELPRATIRFYEKEGLINPKRGEKSYREYSEADVSVLKKIVVLRKIGLSVADIEDFLEDVTPLQDLLGKTITELEEKRNELEAAIRVCKKMQENKESRESFDGEFYWREIKEEERQGNHFMELVNDVVEYEKGTFLRKLDIIDRNGRRRDIKETILMQLIPCVVTGLAAFFFNGMKWQGFVIGWFIPFIHILVVAIFGLPMHLIGKKHPKLAEVIKKSRIDLVVEVVILTFFVMILYRIFLY